MPVFQIWADGAYGGKELAKWCEEDTPPPWNNLEGRHPRLGDLLVLIYCTAANAYGPCYFLAAHQRDAASEVDDPAVVGRLQAGERLAWLRHLGQVLGRHQK